MLNPFTAPACKVSGHTYTPAHSVSDGTTTNLLSILCSLIKIVSCAHAKGQKKLNDFKFGTFISRFKAGLYQLGSRGGSLKKIFLMSQVDWEPLSASWSQPVWSSGCPAGTHCTPPKPNELAKQLPVCSVHLTRLLPGGSYFCFYTSLMGPRHPTAARWNKQF